MPEGGGHVFVVQGDLTKIACDAWLLPTDAWFRVEDPWADAIARTPGILVGEPPWTSDARVRCLRPKTEHEPGIWLGNVGATGRHASWYADGVVEFVHRAASELRDAGRGRPPLLAVNFVGSGLGGARDRKGDLVDTLVRALDGAAQGDEADVVFVCWDAKAYAAAQRARLLALVPDNTEARALDAASRWGFPDHVVASAVELARHARQGTLALFFGAGASRSANLPGWDELLSKFDGESSTKVLRDPRDRAEVLERRIGKDRFVSMIAERLQSATYSLQHALLSSLPCTEAVTTNFDSLYELAARTGDRRLSVIPSAPDAEAARWLLKLHGSVEKPSDMVLTRSAYLEAGQRWGALFGVVQAMLLTRHMLFVGYSLEDEDFHQLVHEVRYALAGAERTSRLGTVLTLFEDTVREELWERDLHVLPMRAASNTPSADTAAAARDVERFLDLVAFLASDRAAFLLDPEYDGLLVDDDRALKERLSRFSPATEFTGSDAWPIVEQLLGRLGGTPARNRRPVVS